jgi:hypothetical protein
MAAPAKKRSFMPMVSGAVAVLALGGGAWAVFGHKTPANGGQLPGDTTKQVATVPPKDTSKARGTRQNNTTTPRDTLTLSHSTSGIDLAHAGRALYDLSGAVLDEKITPGAGRDSAMRFYYANLNDSLRAFAANIVVQTYMSDGDRTKALDWVNRAVNLRPGDTSLVKLKQRLQGGP